MRVARPLSSEGAARRGGTAAALRLVPGLDVTVLDTGCCGMAGSFGFEREHYDLSVQDRQPRVAAGAGESARGPRRRTGNVVPAPDQGPGARRALHPLEVLEEQLV